MKTITVRKDMTINTGNFSNIKIGAEITTDEMDWETAWNAVSMQVLEQEMKVKNSNSSSPEVVKGKPF